MVKFDGKSAELFCDLNLPSWLRMILHFTSCGFPLYTPGNFCFSLPTYLNPNNWDLLLIDIYWFVQVAGKMLAYEGRSEAYG